MKVRKLLAGFLAGIMFFCSASEVFADNNIMTETNPENVEAVEPKEAVTPGEAEGANIITLSLGKPVTGSLEKDETAIYEFTPEVDGSYIFQSFSDEDTYGELYDSAGKILEESDDDGENRNFYIKQKLVSGETYYLHVYQYSYKKMETYTVLATVDTNLTADSLGSDKIAVKPGKTTNLEVVASANEGIEISYQWYKEEKYYEDNFYKWMWIPIEGANEASYTTEEITEKINYRCQVTDECGNREIVYFYITADTGLKIEGLYENNITVEVGEDTTLEVKASADEGITLTYEWYKDYWNIIEGANSASYEIEGTQSCTYRCSVSDGYGNYEDVYFTVTVDTGFTVENTENSILIQPGEKATLEVKASADEGITLSYQWYIDYWNKIVGANGASYETEENTKSGIYKCVVSDGYGNKVSVYFTVTVDTGFTVENTENNIIIQPGEKATLEVKASADEGIEISYQWCDKNLSKIEGANEATYETTENTQSGIYKCVVSDEYGNQEYATFYVTVDTGLTVENEENDICVDLDELGITKTLNVIATAKEGIKLTYQWFEQKQIYGIDFGYDWVWDPMKGETSDSYEVEEITKSGRYLCLVTDEYGNEKQAVFDIRINTGFKVEWNCELQLVPYGTTKQLKVSASADEGIEITYQWYSFYGVIITGATAAEYETDTITGLNSYSCIITDEYGNYEVVNYRVRAISDASTESLGINESVTGSVASNKYVIYEFTPEKDGIYRFRTEGEDDITVGLFDSEGNELVYDNNSDGDHTFTTEQSLTGGKTYYLAVVGDESTDLSGTKVKYTVSVNEIVDISACDVAVDSSSCVFDGKEKTPEVTVKDGTQELTEGTDYTVSYSNNTNAGTATVTITGIGDYKGTLTKDFTIKKASQALTAKIAASSLIYGKTGKITASGKGKITYSSSNTSVATVSSGGVVTAKGAGNATITVKAAGDANYNSATKTIKVTVQYATPSITSVSNISGGVQIKWAKVSGAAKYRVYRKTESGWLRLTETTGTSYTDKTAKSGTTYVYTVRCVSSDGKSFTSGYNKTGKSIVRLSQPAPTLSNTTSGVKISWSKVTGASGYYVYCKTGNGSWKKIKTTSSTNYTDTAAKNGTTYYYTVKAYKGSSTSSYVTTKKIARLSTPSISSATNSASKKMTVKWAKNASATGYEIRYVTGSTTKTVTVSGASTVSKVISGLTKGKTYKVYVRSYKTVSGTKYYSTWSSAKSVKITK